MKPTERYRTTSELYFSLDCFLDEQSRPPYMDKIPENTMISLNEKCKSGFRQVFVAGNFKTAVYREEIYIERRTPETCTVICLILWLKSGEFVY